MHLNTYKSAWEILISSQFDSEFSSNNLKVMWVEMNCKNWYLSKAV